jgi:CDGSH-type Zn-finger protein
MDDEGERRAGSAPVVIQLMYDGPLQVRGEAVIQDGSGGVIRRATGVALCRCGASREKPFCDGSHRVVRFRGE